MPISIVRYPDDTIKFFCSYKEVNGKRVAHGTAFSYYPNGNVKLQANYVDGNVDGEMRENSECGKECIIRNYVHGVGVGNYAIYIKKRLVTTGVIKGNYSSKNTYSATTGNLESCSSRSIYGRVTKLFYDDGSLMYMKIDQEEVWFPPSLE